ncbi:efflux RND transporter permease subunit, partial [uncultured Rikenella sp.]|uniref:efflux RND transporter permease subunit n=1 Tax=uncultured Rikenella sp. TaxID=368003 RepID=UPI0026065426
QSIMGVSDMLYLQTTSASDGTMALTATFAVDSDPDMNAVFTQNRVATATPMLPSEVRQQGLTTVKSMSGYLMVFAIYSDGRYDDNFLANYAYINIQNEVLKIDGVGKVQIMGSGEYSMRIWIKPDVLDYLDVSLNDITSAIEAQSGVFPAGKLGGEPSPRGTEFTYTVTMPPQINSAEEYENIVIRTLPDGGQIRLGDVARVELGSQTYGVNSNFNQHPAAMIVVYQAPGSNAMEVGSAVKAKMEEISQKFNDGIGYDVVVDATQSIRSGISDIVTTLVIALVLVVLIIYLFIQDIRAMIVPVVAIPVSLVGAFMLFPLLGFSVNIFSLLGLILAIGLVVDDAIVVIEAVQVNIASGMNPKQATRAAMKSVSGPIIATTVVLAAVFIPVSFIGGITGKLYQQFAITIALSVVISSFNALTLSPALCSLVLRKKEPATKGFFGLFNRWFNRRVEGYLSFSKTVARHAGRSLVFIAVIGLAIFGLARAIPGGFLPQEDQGYLMIGINLPNAASVERTQQAVTEIQRIVSQRPEVRYTAGVAGFNMLSGVASSNSGVLFVTLVDYSQRKTTAMQLADQLNDELYVRINDAQAFAFQSPAIPGLGTTSGVSLMVQDRGGNGIPYLARYTDEFLEKARNLPEISTVTTQFDAGVPQRKVMIDENQAFQQGVSLDEIHSVLATYLGGAYINNFNRFGKIYQTYVQSEAEYRQTKDDLMSYFVTNAEGESVPLASFVSIGDTTGVEFVTQFNLYRSIALNANAASAYSSTQAMDALQALADSVLPRDVGIAWSGMSFQERNASGNGIGAFVIAVVFVFLILAALYESWTLPWSILLGVPFAVFGAMAFIFLARLFDPVYVDNIFMQISLILLIGLSAKNAILIVEYANEAFFDEGKDVVTAAMEAAHLRFRPIIMTALAFLLGVTPLIFASGASSVAQTVMGVALVGGMGVATLFGVFVYPALYAFIAKVGRFERIRERRLNDLKDEKSEKQA